MFFNGPYHKITLTIIYHHLIKEFNVSQQIYPKIILSNELQIYCTVVYPILRIRKAYYSEMTVSYF